MPSLEGLRVLVVDEGVEARDMVAAILEKRGAPVAALPARPAARAGRAEGWPDGLLLVRGLADAGVDSLIRKIRALPASEGGATPAAALSAFGASDRTRALLAGFQLQLAKPVRPSELVAAVASLTGRTGQPAVVAEEARA
jgi:CheY-like chemotaxis protein